MSVRRELLAAIGLCLTGAALVLLAMSRSWLVYRTGAAPLPSRRLEISGARLAPGARVLGLVGLAGVAALPAARRLGRTAVGVLLAGAGLGLLADLVRVLTGPGAAVRRLDLGARTSDLDLGVWPYVAALGGLLITAAGVLAIVRGRRWEGMSARYNAPTEVVEDRPVGQAALWDALDRGEDPTGAAAERDG